MSERQSRRTESARTSQTPLKFYMFVFGAIFIVGGITAGMLIDKSSILTPNAPSAFFPEKVLEKSNPVSTACTNFAIDENAGTDSQLVKINSDLTSLSLVKTYPCSGGICQIEAMDADNSGILYAISNSKKAIYKVGKSSGNLSFSANISSAYNIISMSFRKNDNSLWVWAPSKGLYTLNPVTGMLTLRLASSLDFMDGMAWDNDSQYLYFSRAVGGLGETNELRRYDPSTNIISYYASLPGDTDAIDFGPDGLLHGSYREGNGILRIYKYDVDRKEVINTYTITTSNSNLDAFASCVPN